MIYVMARYRVKKGKIEEIKKAIIDFVDAIRKNEPGTLFYDSFQEEDSLSFVHFMSFKDEKAREFHTNTAHVKKFVGILYPECEEEPVFTELKLIRSNKVS